MRRRSAWKIENYTYRECPHPDREFGYAVSLHNHSCHSVENLAALNQVVQLAFMRPLSGILQNSFGLGGVSDLNYAEITFNPPYTPQDVYEMEAAAATNWGFQGVHLAITDHDEFAGSLALLRGRPDLNGRIAVSEELSLWFQGHLFHLGVSHMPESAVEETHTRMQAAARGGRYDELFETLAASGSLVALNHPLLAWKAGEIPVTELLSRYGWAIHALEVNGMRSREGERSRSGTCPTLAQTRDRGRRQPSAGRQFHSLSVAGRNFQRLYRRSEGRPCGAVRDA
jgi:hypothetical protein